MSHGLQKRKNGATFLQTAAHNLAQNGSWLPR